MNRRRFLASSAGLAVASRLPAAPAPTAPRNRTSTAIAAYYLNAHMYTSVPRHVRADLEWMADVGTQYVCPGVLEQDLFAARENHALILAEAARVGLKVLAVPSRWAGLTAGAPKVPSLFSAANPDTWMVNKRGTTFVSPNVSSVISSIHHPKTLQFFCDTLAELYRQHPTLAGFILDEPKAFNVDTSPLAVAALGATAPLEAHLGAARDFYSKICRFAKERWPDKLTIMFQKADNHTPAELAAGGGVGPLDYYGCDGRPWTREEDARFPPRRRDLRKRQGQDPPQRHRPDLHRHRTKGAGPEVVLPRRKSQHHVRDDRRPRPELPRRPRPAAGSVHVLLLPAQRGGAGSRDGRDRETPQALHPGLKVRRQTATGPRCGRTRGGVPPSQSATSRSVRRRPRQRARPPTPHASAPATTLTNAGSGTAVMVARVLPDPGPKKEVGVAPGPKTV